MRRAGKGMWEGPLVADGEGYPRAEEALRLLAAAVGAARLYPPASALPREAAERFTDRVNLLTGTGPLRFTVEPHGFRVGDAEIAAGQGQVVSLAESLHAMQAGQLVLAPGITLAETMEFVILGITEPSAVRQAGGPRSVLVSAGVTHIAVIELSLRASEESGLYGLDLTTAPLDDIAAEVAAAAERRARAAAQGRAHDEMADVIGRLEAATREIAMERVAAAMMRLDEETRMRVLGMSLMADAEGTRMEGMLDAIARMKPAALARLLTLVAAQASTEPSRLAGALTLPPETAALVGMLLAPTPSIEPDFGVSAPQQAANLAAEMLVEEDTTDLERQVAVAGPALASGRALATAVAVSRTRLDAETIRAIGEVLPQAARDGAFTTVREALRRLDEIAHDPSLMDEVVAARGTLADPQVLSDVCRAPATDADAAIAGEILHAAGPLGADALLDCYIRSAEPARSLLRPVLRSMSETVLGAARSRLRTADARTATAIVRTLPSLGDKRAIPVIAGTLDSSLDEQVRFAAATALASIPVPEATQALIKAIGHREPETQRYVVRELGRIKAAAAVTPLSRAFDDISRLSPTYETRKEILSALRAIGTPEAEKVLRRLSGRITAFGRKSRELKNQARRAVEELTSERGVDAP